MEGWEGRLLEELEDLIWVELGRGNVISKDDIKRIPGTYRIYSSSVKNDGHMGVIRPLHVRRGADFLVY